MDLKKEVAIDEEKNWYKADYIIWHYPWTQLLSLPDAYYLLLYSCVIDVYFQQYFKARLGKIRFLKYLLNAIYSLFFLVLQDLISKMIEVNFIFALWIIENIAQCIKFLMVFSHINNRSWNECWYFHTDLCNGIWGGLSTILS